LRQVRSEINFLDIFFLQIPRKLATLAATRLQGCLVIAEGHVCTKGNEFCTQNRKDTNYSSSAWTKRNLKVTGLGESRLHSTPAYSYNGVFLNIREHTLLFLLPSTPDMSSRCARVTCSPFPSTNELVLRLETFALLFWWSLIDWMTDWLIDWFIHSFCYVLRQVHSFFQSQFFTECDLVLSLSISNILGFKGHSVSAYVFFLVFLSLPALLLSFLN
jgi:hypothetical protein